MNRPTLLIIDDNKEFTDSVELVMNNFNVICANSVIEARSKLCNQVDLVLLDLVFNEQTPDEFEGLDFIPHIKESYPDIQIIVLTNYPSIETTVSAVRAGAIDFLNKRDLNWIEWKNRLFNYASSSIQIKELKERNIELENDSDEGDIIGTSQAVKFLCSRLKDLAENSADAGIFLTGETGTGKNHAARYFRKHSVRKNKAYRECSILELSESLVESELFGHVKGAFTGATQDKKGLFEQADGGILFLDEIGDYDLKIQSKILRFLDNKVITPVGSGKSKQLDLQLILASNQDIPSLIKDKKFREDLYQRINQIRIELPPLRNRKDDIPILTNHFFNHFRMKEKTKLISIHQDVIHYFSNYEWPGNIRELQSVIWDACTKARLYSDSVLQVRHLKSELSKQNELKSYVHNNSFSSKERIAYYEMDEIESALKKSYGQKAIAASLMGISADQLRYKVLKLKREYPELLAQFPNLIKAY